MAAGDLTDQQLRFIAEYLVDLNASAAAKRAGYSEHSADQQAWALMQIPEVRARIHAGLSHQVKGTKIRRARVLRELALLAFSDVEHYHIDEFGNLKMAPGAPRGASRAVSSIKRKRKTYTDKDGNPITEVDVEFRLWNKPDMLKLAGRHVGLFAEKVVPDLKDASPEDLATLRRLAERAAGN